MISTRWLDEPIKPSLGQVARARVQFRRGKSKIEKKNGLTRRHGRRGTGHAGHQVVRTSAAGGDGRHGRHLHVVAVRGRGRGRGRRGAGRSGSGAVRHVVAARGRGVVRRRHRTSTARTTTARAGLHRRRRGRRRVRHERVDHQRGGGSDRVRSAVVVVVVSASVPVRNT